ncbi:lipoprotein [Collibacillus ludicampi]|uniref:Lipoprotein n=1 Tax=Collibacillus ludicampi TaxID=2771369 RepID=A0AAV4LBE2_9BACL|nr:MetQ/NlpA family ABC transporter substrate-binding protein [Collibacillus ludicampi]GIM45179.1 lipoprotein [Collibacillus ludicampi]
MRKKLLFVLTTLSLALFLSACGGTTTGTSISSTNKEAVPNDKKVIKIGATAGPYSDQIRKGIQPALEKKGYKVELVEFNDYVQPNLALVNGSIDANVFQNTTYLENFIKEHHVDLTGVIPIPTVPMGLYSKKHHSLDEVKEGTRISIPNDPTNEARALGMLQKFGLIKLKPDADVLHASEKDIIENPKKIEMVPLEAAQLPRSLEDVDFALVNGNYALASGWKLTDAIKLEQTPKNYIIVLTVRTQDKNQPFVKDPVEAYQSKEFNELIDKEFQGFIKP